MLVCQTVEHTDESHHSRYMYQRRNWSRLRVESGFHHETREEYKNHTASVQAIVVRTVELNLFTIPYNQMWWCYSLVQRVVCL